jgi:hypothetical protein
MIGALASGVLVSGAAPSACGPPSAVAGVSGVDAPSSDEHAATTAPAAMNAPNAIYEVIPRRMMDLSLARASARAVMNVTHET